MKITRNNYLEIEPGNSYERSCILQLLNSECKRINPKYEKMKKSGRFDKGITREIQTFKEEKGKFFIYKANYSVYKKLLDLNLPLEKITDKRISNKIDCESTVGPRDNEQRNAITDLYEWGVNCFGYMCLSAAPAAGKTYMAVKLATMFKERTLIIVDMTLLIEQFIESILNFTDIKEEEIGIIRGSELDYGKNKKIIIATAQTLIKKPEIVKQLESEIGFLIVDEVHVASANTFQELIPKFKPRIQLGLSGSHNRDDKMEFLVHEAVGPIVHEISKESLLKAGSIISPTLRPIFIKDNHKFEKHNNDNTDFRTVVDEFYNCPEAIGKISNIVNFHYKDRSQLLICKEKTMVEAYYESILRKVAGSELEQKAITWKKNKLEDLDLDIKLILNKDPLDMMTKKEKSLLEFNNVKKSDMIKKYQSKLDKEMEKLIKQKNKIEKIQWYETDIAKEDELARTIVILTGEIGKVERDRIIRETNEGKIRVLICTTVVMAA
ncbi:MAG: DEAD/DEAH box helicase family protein [Paraclostridium sp.]